MKGQGVEMVPLNSTLLFAVFILGLLVMGLIRVQKPGYLKALISSLLNLRYVQLMRREGRLRWTPTNMYLDLLMLFSTSFLIHQLISISSDSSFAFAGILGIVTGIVVSQLVLALAFGHVFYTLNYILPFILNIIVFNRVLGITLLPLIFLVTFTNILDQKTGFLIIGGLAGVFLLLRALRSLVQMQELLQHGIIYNFCYICIIELGPLVVVVNQLMGLL
jgi:hypothetical protein